MGNFLISLVFPSLVGWHFLRYILDLIWDTERQSSGGNLLHGQGNIYSLLNWGAKMNNKNSYLPGPGVNRDHEGGSPRTRLGHCTSVRLNPTIVPNVDNSRASFLIVEDCVRALLLESLLDRGRHFFTEVTLRLAFSLSSWNHFSITAGLLFTEGTLRLAM